jgi:hypothetical protein
LCIKVLECVEDKVIRKAGGKIWFSFNYASFIKKKFSTIFEIKERFV